MSTASLVLPRLHEGQKEIVNSAAPIRVVMCGRQWGKTYLCRYLTIQTMLQGKAVAYLLPTNGDCDKSMNSFLEWLPQSIIKSSNKSTKEVVLINKGTLHFYSGEAPERIRGKTYHRFIIDEAAYVADLQKVWQADASATLLTTNGDAIFVSTPNGRDYFNKVFELGNEPSSKVYKSFHYPSSTSPFVSQEYLAIKEIELDAEYFRQEYLAIPMASIGNPFGMHHINAGVSEVLSSRRTVVYGIDIAKHVDYTVIIGLDEFGCMTHFDRFKGDWSITKAKILALPSDVLKVMDSTSGGDVVFEEMQEKTDNIIGFVFTGSSKPQLIKELIMDIQAGQLKYNEVTAAEMMAFEYAISREGHPRYRAKSGYHDDCVMSLAMANRYLKQATYAKDWKLYYI